jgi:glycosyltransferase involved in cell wall biosynthesis
MSSTVASEPDAGGSPRVSVVTISRDDIGGLIATRASVERQTYEDVEHIVVDAASADGTRSWLESAGPAIRWISETDEGRFAGMNKGIRLSTGELFWFLNAGDVFSSPGVLRLVVDDWCKRRWRWAYGCERFVSAGGVVTGISAPIPFRMNRLALGITTLPHQAACFEAALVRELGGFDHEFGLAADQLFMLRAAKLSPPATIAEFLCDFDDGGAGSDRPVFAHMLDARRARRLTGATLKGSDVVDALATVGLATTFSLMRIARRRLGG